MTVDLDEKIQIDLENIENSEDHKELKAAAFVYYANNVFQKEEFRDKRFRRYVSKVEQRLTNTINASLSYDKPLFVTSILFCLRYWQNKLDPSINIKHTPAELIRDRTGNMFIKTGELMEKYREDGRPLKQIKGTLSYLEGEYSSNPEKIHSRFRQAYEINRDNCIIDMLVEQNLKENIKQVNYTTYMPSLIEQTELYVNIITRLAYDVESLVCEDVMEAVFIDYKNRLIDEITDVEKYKKMQEELEKIQKRFEFMQREKEQAQKSITALKSEMKAKQEKYESKLTEKDQKIRSLEQKMKSITEKYDRLKSSFSEESYEEETEQQISPNDCDVTKKYKFIMSPWPLVEGQLKDNFPNMTVVPGMEVIMKETTDLVIFMTSHMSHKFYKGIKNQCQDKEIPYIHFKSTNMDKLKIAIAKKLVQNFEE